MDEEDLTSWTGPNLTSQGGLSATDGSAVDRPVLRERFRVTCLLGGGDERLREFLALQSECMPAPEALFSLRAKP